MIQLVNLTCDGFKNLKNVQVNFPPEGNILITGQNESGKSTLFEAIFFALTGTLLAHSKKNSNKDAISYEKNAAIIEVEFIKDGVPAKIKKNISKTRTGAGLTIEFWKHYNQQNEVKIEGSAKEMDPEIEKFIGFDEEILRNSCFVEQKGLDGFASVKKKREEIISKLLNLEKLAELKTDYDKKSLKYEKAVIYYELTMGKKNAENKLKELQIEKVKLQDVRNNYNKLHGQEEKLTNVLKEIPEIQQKLLENEKKIQDIQNQIKTQQDFLVQLEQVEKFYGQIKTHEQQIEKGIIELKGIEKEKITYNEKLAKNKTQFIQLKKSREDLEKINAELLDFEKQKTQFITHEKIIENIKEKTRMKENHEKDKSIAQKNLEKNSTDIDNTIEKIIGDLKKKIETLQESISQITKWTSEKIIEEEKRLQLQTDQEKYKQVNELNVELKSTRESIITQENNKKNLEAETKRLEEQIKTTNNNEKTKAALQKEVDVLSVSITNLKKDFEKRKIIEEANRKLEGEKSQLDFAHAKNKDIKDERQNIETILRNITPNGDLIEKNRQNIIQLKNTSDCFSKHKIEQENTNLKQKIERMLQLKSQIKDLTPQQAKLILVASGVIALLSIILAIAVNIGFITMLILALGLVIFWFFNINHKGPFGLRYREIQTIWDQIILYLNSRPDIYLYEIGVLNSLRTYAHELQTEPDFGKRLKILESIIEIQSSIKNRLDIVQAEGFPELITTSGLDPINEDIIFQNIGKNFREIESKSKIIEMLEEQEIKTSTDVDKNKQKLQELEEKKLKIDLDIEELTKRVNRVKQEYENLLKQGPKETLSQIDAIIKQKEFEHKTKMSRCKELDEELKRIQIEPNAIDGLKMKNFETLKILENHQALAKNLEKQIQAIKLPEKYNNKTAEKNLNNTNNKITEYKTKIESNIEKCVNILGELGFLLESDSSDKLTQVQSLTTIQVEKIKLQLEREFTSKNSTEFTKIFGSLKMIARDIKIINTSTKSRDAIVNEIEDLTKKVAIIETEITQYKKNLPERYSTNMELFGKDFAELNKKSGSIQVRKENIENFINDHSEEVIATEEKQLNELINVNKNKFMEIRTIIEKSKNEITELTSKIPKEFINKDIKKILANVSNRSLLPPASFFC